jgi:uroporphyrinogen decarboxylase
MNARERFLAVMKFEPVDRTLLWEDGYWVGAVRRWYREGLPERRGVPDSVGDGKASAGGSIPWDPISDDIPMAYDVNEYFGLDESLQRIPLNNYFYPPYTEEVLEDHGDWILWRDRKGVIKRDRKDRTSLPDYLGWPVGCRDDWEQLKAERLRPTVEGRLPSEWPAWVESHKSRTYPLAVALRQGLYWTARDLLGDEGVLYTFHDDPDLIRDIMNYLTDFWIALYDPILEYVEADCAWLWEDMSFKNGPLISPAMIREFLLPCYQRFTGFLRDHGIRSVLVDSDGDCRLIIPILMEGGISGLMPFEVNAGMDVVEMRKTFPRLQILGGIDKTQLALGKEAIDRELEAKVTPGMLRHGGYIPHVDHQVPPDVSWEDFKYYRQRLAALIGTPNNA